MTIYILGLPSLRLRAIGLGQATTMRGPRATTSAGPTCRTSAWPTGMRRWTRSCTSSRTPCVRRRSATSSTRRRTTTTRTRSPWPRFQRVRHRSPPWPPPHRRSSERQVPIKQDGWNTVASSSFSLSSLHLFLFPVFVTKRWGRGRCGGEVTFLTHPLPLPVETLSCSSPKKKKDEAKEFKTKELQGLSHFFSLCRF